MRRIKSLHLKVGTERWVDEMSLDSIADEQVNWNEDDKSCCMLLCLLSGLILQTLAMCYKRHFAPYSSTSYLSHPQN